VSRVRFEQRDYLRNEVLRAYLCDDTRATMLSADGQYEPIRAAAAGAATVDAQQRLMSNRLALDY